MLKDRVEQWMEGKGTGTVYTIMDDLESSRSHTTKVLNELVQEGAVKKEKGWQKRGGPMNIYTIKLKLQRVPRRTFKQRFMEMLGL